MKTDCTEGGWIWWVRQYKLAHPDKVLEECDYKTLLQKYMRGEKPE